jgi:5'-deoxynucleotidase YfbR-like HD superfamily hydrolase
MTQPEAPWIQTYTGRAVDLLMPRVEQIDVRDIAHALANLCRFTGHTNAFYSVAQHSCLVARIVEDLWQREHGEKCPAPVALAALLHDAPEAYLGDVNTPLKRAMRRLGGGGASPYDEIAARFEAAIEWVLCPGELPTPQARELIKRADSVALATEYAQLFHGTPPRPWGEDLSPTWFGYKITPWPSFQASLHFMDAFHAYGGRATR